MRLRGVVCGLFAFGLLHAVVPALAQRTLTPDSAATPAPDVIIASDNSGLKKTAKDQGLSKPGRAALYSAVLPGAGQFYNKHYWKIPIVYAVIGTLGGFVVFNNTKYQEYRKAYIYRIDGDKTTVDKFVLTLPGSAGANALLLNRDFYHTNRDFSIILTLLAYGMNIVEANVGAHLNEYDISDDLSLQVKPNVQFGTFGANPVPVLSLNLRLKK
jgi:hypothetical protein